MRNSPIALALCATVASGCYRSHSRVESIDASARPDAPSAEDAGPPVDAWSCGPTPTDLTATGRDCSDAACPLGYDCIAFPAARACYIRCSSLCGCPAPLICGGGGLLPPGSPLVCGVDCPACGLSGL